MCVTKDASGGSWRGRLCKRPACHRGVQAPVPHCSWLLTQPLGGSKWCSHAQGSPGSGPGPVAATTGSWEVNQQEGAGLSLCLSNNFKNYWNQFILFQDTFSPQNRTDLIFWEFKKVFAPEYAYVLSSFSMNFLMSLCTYICNYIYLLPGIFENVCNSFIVLLISI